MADKASKTAKPKLKPDRPRSNIEKKRVSFYLPTVVVQKLDDFAYQKGMPATRALTEILISFFKDKKIKPRPADEDLETKLRNLE